MEVVKLDDIGPQAWIRSSYRFYDDFDAQRPHHEDWLKDLIDGKPRTIGGPRRFIAARDGEAIVARVFVYQAGQCARFGLLDCSPEHLEAIPELIDAARETAREWGVQRLVGPISIDALYSIGVMTSGFDHVAPIFADFARPEYAEALEQAGPVQTTDLQSWRWNAAWGTPGPARQIAAATRVHPGLQLRPIRRDDFAKRDARVLAELHADAYAQTLHYQPLDAHAMSWLLRGGDAIDSRCSSIVEIDGEPAGAVVVTPNINELGLTAAEQDRPWANLHDRIVQALRVPDSVRVFMFGVRQAYRGAAVGGLATLLWSEFTERARAAGYHRAETPTVRVDDEHRSNGFLSIGLKPARRYRLFTYEV